MTFSSIWLNSHDCRREGKFSNYASSSISSQGRLLIMIPHLIGGYYPILADSRTLYNSPLYMPELTASLFPSSIEAWNSLHFDVASKNSWLSFKRALHN